MEVSGICETRREDTVKKEKDGEVADGCSRPTGEEVGSRSG